MNRARKVNTKKIGTLGHFVLIACGREAIQHQSKEEEGDDDYDDDEMKKKQTH